MKKWLYICILGPLTSGLLSGCPDLLRGIDASGTFDGMWAVATTEEDGAVEACPLSLDLTQIVFADDPIESTEVTGFVALDFTCFGTLQLLLEFQDLEVGEVEVVGNMLPGGNLILRSTDLLGGCRGDICISLILVGVAVDGDGDGLVDSMSGTWSALLPVPSEGAFEASRITDEAP